ncbi:flagellar export chaperone FliS [Paenibacillus aquistagni]|uniref:flagellar export chaperone FliS n=1 Tax=Paenibacillus aquistagni TaxID=1852522 RepID=UPI000B4FED3F|nr:flagellar export chaperone FliS [Paenibacillus aquistagni]
MNPTAVKGYQAYQKNKYETASPHRLILMLYHGAIRFVKQAKNSLDAGDTEQGHQHLLKAQDIVYELISSLNEQQGGEIASNLKNLYLYMIDQMMQANMKKNSESLTIVLEMLESIKEAWEQIGKELNTGHAYA